MSNWLFNKSRSRRNSFTKRMITNITKITSVLISVGTFLSLGFFSNSVIKGFNNENILEIQEEVLKKGVEEVEKKNKKPHRNAAPVFLLSQMIEENTVTALTKLANEKREQRIREEERKQAEKERHKKEEELCKKKKEKRCTEQARKAKEVSRGGISINKNDLDLLEKIVMAEAGTEPYEGKIAVVNVIMNRVAHKSFPNTIRGVILQKGQFTPAGNGVVWKMKPSKSVKKAVQEALDGRRVVGKDVLYFLNPHIATDHTIPKTKKFVKRIGSHYFYK